MTQLRRTCQHSLLGFPYGDLRIKSSMMPGKEPYPRWAYQSKALIEQISNIYTHVNPNPMSLFQYSALNGVYIVTEAGHGSLLIAQNSQKPLLDLFKANIGTPTFLTPCRSRIKL